MQKYSHEPHVVCYGMKWLLHGPCSHSHPFPILGLECFHNPSQRESMWGSSGPPKSTNELLMLKRYIIYHNIVVY